MSEIKGYISTRVILDAKSLREADESISVFKDIIKKHGQIENMQREKYDKFKDSYMFSFRIKNLQDPMQVFISLLEDLGSHWISKRLDSYNGVYDAVWDRKFEESGENKFFPNTKISWCFMELIEE